MNFKHCTIPLSSLGLAAALGTTALAQESDAPGDKAPPARVEITGTAASYDPRRDDTASKIVVGREEIQRYGDASVLDVLKRVPGITINSSSGRGGEIRMRGLGAGYTQILVNGERAPAGFSFDALAPELVERIEVLRAATAELSTQSVAGTINIVLRRAARKAQRSVKLGVLASSVFKGPNATIEVGDREEGYAYSVTAVADHDRYQREFLGVEENALPDGRTDMLRTTTVQEKGRRSRLNLNARLDWTLDGGSTLASQTFVNIGPFRNRAHVSVLTRIGAPPPVPENATSMAFDNNSLRSDLTWTRALASAAKLETRLGISASRRRNIQHADGTGPGGAAVVDRRIATDTRDLGVSSTGKYLRTLENGHALAFGWDAGLDLRDDERIERNAVPPPLPGLPGDEDFDARVARLAFYGQDEWNLTPQWSVYLGLRWEGIRTAVSGSSFARSKLRSGVWSPLAQSLWKLPGGKGEQLRVALSRTYKAPRADTLVPRRNIWDNNSATEADYQGNPDLRPELAWGVDAAYERFWAEGAMVALTASLRRITDYTSNRVYFDGRRWIFTPVNEDRAALRSLGIETKFPLKAIMADAPALELRAAVTRNWSRVAAVPGPGNRINEQTPLSANLGIDYKTGKLTAGGSLAFRNAGLVRITANRNAFEHARTDLEAYTAWTFDSKSKLRVAVSNLLGEDEGFEISYADPVAGTEKRSWRFPGGPQLRASYEFSF